MHLVHYNGIFREFGLWELNPQLRAYDSDGHHFMIPIPLGWCSIYGHECTQWSGGSLHWSRPQVWRRNKGVLWSQDVYILDQHWSITWQEWHLSRRGNIKNMYKTLLWNNACRTEYVVLDAINLNGLTQIIGYICIKSWFRRFL